MIGKILTKKEQKKISEEVINFEEATGAELLIVIANSSDPYPGATMRMALYLSLSFSLLITYFIQFDLDYIYVLIPFILVLFFLPISRINSLKKYAFINAELEREVGEKALEIFHTHCSSLTSHDNEAMLYVSLLERKIEIIFGKNIDHLIKDSEKEELIKNFEDAFKEANYFTAYEENIQKLQEIILKANDGQKLSDISSSELNNEIIWL